MSKLDGAKEEIGWLKVVFAVCAAVDVSLLAWIAQTYVYADRRILILAIVSAAVATALLLWMNYTAYRKIRELSSSP